MSLSPHVAAAFLALVSRSQACLRAPEWRAARSDREQSSGRPVRFPPPLDFAGPLHDDRGGTPAGAALAAHDHRRPGRPHGHRGCRRHRRRRHGHQHRLQPGPPARGPGRAPREEHRLLRHVGEVLGDRPHPLHDAADRPDGAPRPRHLRAVGRRGGRGMRLRADRHAVRRAAREPGPGRAHAPDEPGGRDRGEPDRARRRPPDQPAPPGPRGLGRGVRAPLGLRQPPRGRVELRPPLHGARRRAAAVDPGHGHRHPRRPGPQRDARRAARSPPPTW